MDALPRRRRIALGLALALPVVAAGVFLVARNHAGSAEPGTDDRRRAYFPNFPETAPSPVAPTAEALDQRIQAVLSDWRTAILVRDADSLMKVDGIFLETPAMYLDALKKTASSDDNERVRAFSTRELGKFKRVDLAPTFTQLLADKSRFVRQNAAWALGELTAIDDGRAAARQAIAELRRVVTHDPADEVRAAARATLERM
jgi:HEAT repeat protein